MKIRAPFIVGDRWSEPPIQRISAPRGLNLQLYLIAIFEAHCRKRNGIVGPSPLTVSMGAPDAPSWVDLVVSRAKGNLQAVNPITERGNRVRQVKSAFARLAAENLALRNVGTPSKPMAVMLLHESGASASEKYDYAVPAAYEVAPSVVTLSELFFMNGWVHLMSDSEIRMYLVLKHLSARFPRVHKDEGVFCSERERESLYRISRDVYEAHLALEKFGLIERVRDPSRHADGKVVNFHQMAASGETLPPHRFRVAGNLALSDFAFARIRRAMLNFPLSFAESQRRRELGV
ncbi:hypothetical protein [Streptomyces axinellae]|uniref:hypothetical protein n=1 Tax=Streptomyces axinellae TaxID=552788 RepID=UPI0031D08045